MSIKADKVVDFLIQEFSLENKNKTILITGDWGVGKSYYINKFLDKKSLKKINNKWLFFFNKYKFVTINLSLFGKKTVSEINNTILSKINYQSQIYILGQRVFKFFNKNVPDVSEVFSTIKPTYKIAKRKRHYIFVFDDLERCFNDDILKEVLGYIENLSLNKNVGVILVAKEDKIENDEKYREYKEKVVDQTYRIDYPSDEAIKYLLGKNNLLLFKNIDSDDIKIDLFKNLRTIIKITRVFDKVNEIAEAYKDEKFSDLVIKQINGRLLFLFLEKEEKHYSNRYEQFQKENKKEKDSSNKIFAELSNSIETIMENDINEFTNSDHYYNNFFKILQNWINTADYNELDKIVKMLHTQYSNRIEEINPYLLSDKNKIKYLTEVKQKLYKQESNFEELQNLIESFYYFNIRYELNIKISEIRIFQIMVKTFFKQYSYEEIDGKIINSIDSQKANIDLNGCADAYKKINDLIIKVKNEIKKQYTVYIANKTNQAVKIKNFKEAASILNNIIKESFYYQFDSQALVKCFKTDNSIIPQIFATDIDHDQRRYLFNLFYIVNEIHDSTLIRIITKYCIEYVNNEKADISDRKRIQDGYKNYFKRSLQ